MYNGRGKKYLSPVLDPYITEVPFSRSVMKLPRTGLVCNGASHSFMRGACSSKDISERSLLAVPAKEYSPKLLLLIF